VSRRAEGHALPVLAAAAACAPDLDLVLHLFAGPEHHRGPSHSIGLSLGCGVLVGLAARLRGSWPAAARVGGLAAAAWFSHVALDWLGSDSRLPLGVMALWPLRDSYHAAPFPVFMDVGRELAWSTVLHNSVAMAWEIVVLLPLLVLARRRASG
jgi:membrane-bound metal-dependent hydrolase YbcI (DUF457 family)